MARNSRERKIAALARELAIDPDKLPEILPRLSELTEDEESRRGKQLNVLSLHDFLETSFPERESLLSPKEGDRAGTDTEEQ